jgi:hypothetical protein
LIRVHSRHSRQSGILGFPIRVHPRKSAVRGFAFPIPAIPDFSVSPCLRASVVGVPISSFPCYAQSPFVTIYQGFKSKNQELRRFTRIASGNQRKEDEP